MTQFVFHKNETGTDIVRTHLSGYELLHHPSYNKGSAFTEKERKAFHLEGILPPRVTTIEEQCARLHAGLEHKTDPLEKFIGLISLLERNECLFFRMLNDHLEEYMPIVYTPTVGKACQEFSHIFRKLRGIWITPAERGRIREVFRNAPFENIRLIVVTDNERILGLGDQGAGGMGIPVGKLSLYIAGAGIHPTRTLPISLDVGTDNQTLLKDPFYLGYRKPRLRGAEYASLLEEFVEAVKECFPNALLQWEDFKQQNAFDLLDRYRDRILSFNDDIQGTAAIALAGILAACRATHTPLSRQRVLILGAGAAGIGIARLIKDRLEKDGVDPETIERAIALSDSHGLLVTPRTYKERSKEEFSWPSNRAQSVGIPESAFGDFAALVKAFKPTVLIGTSGQPDTFTEEMIRSMLAGCDHPIVMPFSNPTSQSETTPEKVIRWTDGRAFVATGSPFAPVEWKGKTHRTGQGNNVYIFPGVGLGALVSESKKVTDEMFSAAAGVVAGMVSDADLKCGALYPPLSELRTISAKIAEAVVRVARDRGYGKNFKDDEIAPAVKRFMWFPNYPELQADSK